MIEFMHARHPFQVRFDLPTLYIYIYGCLYTQIYTHTHITAEGYMYVRVYARTYISHSTYER